MRILGIDPGSVITGFGVIDHLRGESTLVEQGIIRAGRDVDFSTRLQNIHTAVGAVIARTSPSVVAVEAPFSGQNARSLIQLCHARGVILLAARSAGLEIFEYAPRSIKSTVVGYGAADKEQICRMVRILVRGVTPQKLLTDAADALAVAVCHAHHAGTASRIAVQQRP